MLLVSQSALHSMFWGNKKLWDLFLNVKQRILYYVKSETNFDSLLQNPACHLTLALNWIYSPGKKNCLEDIPNDGKL